MAKQHATLITQQQRFTVLALSGKEAISQPFEYQITITKATTVTNDWLLQPATLKLEFGDSTRSICGVIRKIRQQLIDDAGHEHWEITLSPKLSLLDLDSLPAVYVDQSIPTILQTLLTNTAEYTQPQIINHLSQQSTVVPMTIHPPTESTADFFQRLVSHHGMAYWFTSDDQQELLHLSDQNNQFDYYQPVLTVRPPSGMDQHAASNHRLRIYHLEDHYHQPPPQQLITAINPQIPGKRFQARVGDAAFGTEEHVMIIRAGQEEAERLAKLHFAQRQLQQHHLIAHANIPSLFPGQVIELDSIAINRELSGQYLITALEQHWQQNVEHTGNDQAYRQILRLSPIAYPYRSPWVKLPALPEFDLARVESLNPHAMLDDQGRYRLRFYFDTSDQPLGKASAPVTMRQPFAGPSSNSMQPDTGMHFPLRHGTEVLIGYLHSHPDFPYIAGALPTHDQRSPVTQQNRQQHIIQSPAGQRLLLDDTPNQRQIVLASAKDQHRLELRHDQNPGISWQSQGSQRVIADGDICTTTQGDRLEQTQASRYELAGEGYTLNADGDISQQAGKDIQHIAERNINISSKASSMMQSGDTLTLTSGDALHIEAQGKQQQIIANGGKLTIHAKQGIEILGDGQGDIIFQAANGDTGFKLTPAGHVVIWGQELALKAKQSLQFKGQVNQHAYQAVNQSSATKATNPSKKLTAKNTIVDVIYLPTTKTFYPVTGEQLDALLTSEQQLNQPRQQLQAALQTVSEKTTPQQLRHIQQLRDSVLAALAQMTNHDPAQLLEIVHLVDNPRWAYVKKSSQQFLHWAIAHTDIGDNFNELANKIAEKVTGKQDQSPNSNQKSVGTITVDIPLIKNCGHTFTQWANSVNEKLDHTAFEYHHLKVNEHVQVMRFAGGTSIHAGFNPITHASTLGFNGHAEFNVASGELSTQVFCPNETGLPVKISDSNGKILDMGCFRANFLFDLNGFAGASIQLSANIEFGQDSEKSFLKNAKRSPLQQSFFAGIKIGGDISGTLSWHNVESVQPPTDQSKQHEAITGPGHGAPIFKPIAKVGGGITAMAGVGESKQFAVSYDITTQQFNIIVGDQVVAGLGFGGRLCLTIDIETIVEFFTFLYHQIKNNNFNYTGLFFNGAYEAWVGYVTVSLWEARELEAFEKDGLTKCTQWIQKLAAQSNQTADIQRQLIKNILSTTNDHQLKLAPPETKGRWLYQLIQQPLISKQYWQYDIWHRQSAIIKILGYIQSQHEYHVVLKNIIPLTEASLQTKPALISLEQGRTLLFDDKISLLYVGSAIRAEYNALEHGLDDMLKSRAKACVEQMEYRAEAYQAMAATKLDGLPYD